MSTAVVVDAGPIIHLAEVDSLAFLNLFQRLHIPDEVWHETVGQQRVTIEQVQVLRSLQRITVPTSDCEYFIQQNDLLHLHRGELECLYLCHSQRIDTLLTDDLAVRDAAKRLQITPVGTLGVIVRAFHSQLISIEAAEQMLHRLHSDSSLFVTAAIIELAVQQLRLNNRT